MHSLNRFYTDFKNLRDQCSNNLNKLVENLTTRFPDFDQQTTKSVDILLNPRRYPEEATFEIYELQFVHNHVCQFSFTVIIQLLTRLLKIFSSSINIFISTPDCGIYSLIYSYI